MKKWITALAVLILVSCVGGFVGGWYFSPEFKAWSLGLPQELHVVSEVFGVTPDDSLGGGGTSLANSWVVFDLGYRRRLRVGYESKARPSGEIVHEVYSVDVMYK